MSVELHIEGLNGAISFLDQTRDRAQDLRPMWGLIGGALVTSTQERFYAGGPKGSPWPPSIRALTEGGQTLIDTAFLLHSFRHEDSEHGTEIGTNAEYAPPHQFGDGVPARPFLMIDTDDEVTIIDIAEAWILPKDRG